MTRIVELHSGISVIMPVYNGANFISLSLPPLIEMQRRGEVLEVIVIDDGSTDESKIVAEQIGAKVLSSGGRMGPGGARNQAAKIARGDILWFVDADVVVHDDAAQCLHRDFEDQHVVAVFGSYDNKPAARNFFSQYKNLAHHYYHQRANNEARTFWSGCGAVRRASFLTSGGFDVERYKYPSVEDIELGYRLIRMGGQVRMDNQMQCTHLKVWRLGNLLHTEIFRRAIPWSRLILTSHEAIPDDLNVGQGEQVRAIVAAVFWLAIFFSLVGLINVQYMIFAVLLMIFANLDFALFFRSRGGFLFACGSLLFHQVYYLYSSCAFAWVMIEQIVLKRIHPGLPT